MARENPTSGEERIADELMLKLGIEVSPRTVGKYLKTERPEVEAPINVGQPLFGTTHRRSSHATSS